MTDSDNSAAQQRRVPLHGEDGSRGGPGRPAAETAESTGPRPGVQILPAEATNAAAPSALAKVTAELDATQSASEELRKVAAEFQELRDRLAGQGAGNVVDAMVDGVRVPFPATTILRAKQAELSQLSESWEAAMRQVRAAVGHLLEQVDLPPDSQPAAGELPQAEAASAVPSPADDTPGGGLFEEIAEALAEKAASESAADFLAAASDRRNAPASPVEPRRPDARPAPMAASPPAAAPFRLRIPGQSAADSAPTAAFRANPGLGQQPPTVRFWPGGTSAGPPAPYTAR